MAKKPINLDECDFYFFAKRHLLDDNGEFKVDRMTVRVFPEVAGHSEGLWYAELIGFNENFTVRGDLAHSPPAASKKLEERLDSIYRAVSKLYANYDA